MKYEEIDKDESKITTRFGSIEISTFCGGYDRVLVYDSKENQIATIFIHKVYEKVE